MKHLAWCSILFALCAVAAMANPCPPNDGSWIETGSIPNPAGTITFDDLSFSSAVGWNSASNPPILVYDANGRNASISNGGFLFNSISQTTNKNRWDGQQNWFEGGGQPGYYWNLFGDATDHGELIFNVPVGMVTVKNIGSASTIDTARFEYYDENDNLIGCITNITENSGTNVFRYRGVITMTPIKKIRIYSAQMLDEISFADAVCKADSCDVNARCFNAASNNGSVHCICKDGYEGDGFTCSDKDECLTSPCSVNANCTNTDGSYTCACNTGYEGDGKTCTVKPPVAPSSTNPSAVKVSAALLNSLSLLVLGAGVLLLF